MTRTMLKVCHKSGKKNGVPLYRNPKHSIYCKTAMSILCCYFFCHPISKSVSIPVKCA